MNDASKPGEDAKPPRARKTIHLGWNKPGQPRPDPQSPPVEAATPAEAADSTPAV